MEDCYKWTASVSVLVDERTATVTFSVDGTCFKSHEEAEKYFMSKREEIAADLANDHKALLGLSRSTPHLLCGFGVHLEYALEE